MKHLNVTKYVIFLAVLWTVLVSASLAWNLVETKHGAREAAHSQANASFEKDVLYRRWNAQNGGVYVPATELTPPNPYLSNLPDRELVTPSGRQLTLVNPSYMTRQVFEIAAADNGVQGHITSLKPIRPENAPDAWEAEALKLFEAGATSVSAVQTIDGVEYFRGMNPLVTEESCLRCHATQGYQVGDIRGGISTSVPMESYNAAASNQMLRLDVGHGLIWLTGMVGLIMGSRRFRQSELKRKYAEGEIVQRNSDLAALYKISSELSTEITEINLDNLLAHALDTMCNMKLFNLQNKGGIFLVEDDHLRLAAFKGHDEFFQDLHRDLKLGDCLCGIAARDGEIVISLDSHEDTRHTISYPGMPHHGHVVIPLKTGDQVRGVLYLYTAPGVTMEKRVLDMLSAISSELALVIKNAMLYQKTRSLALHDPLTGLANRNLMQIDLDKRFAMARRFHQPFSLIMMDLDHFKIYNDTYGHTAGDELLRQVAALLRHEVRDVDLVARYGGEELLVIMPDTGSERAREVAQRITGKISAIDFKCTDDGRTTKITVSAGVAAFDESTADAKALITRADTALYHAKHQGRNQVASWRPEFGEISA